MLTEARNLQQEAVARLVAELKTNRKEIVFKAPTGSGKTFMMADFMDRILAENKDIVFLVSSLSKGDLAKQNYDKFCEYKNTFKNINPYLINSDIAGEERLFIPTEYNVYSLPLSLYKKGGRLMQGALMAFFSEITGGLGGLGKKIVLIKDECHIATNNLDDIPELFISKIIDISATPKLARGQYPTVEITNDQAENAKLIKTVEWGDEKDTLAAALAKFEHIKEQYRNSLGVNPCMIIQISNKDKADEELNNTIYPALAARPDLKWMLIVDDKKKCDTNDFMKAKKLPVDKWKSYAKSNSAPIDIIIFKLTISEGWDIPRACMLYQIRETHSKQLDEQVIGRVRRNPRLLDFEKLDENAQNLAMTAWIWGVAPEDSKKVYAVKLWDDPKNITDNIRIKITKLKSLTKKLGFDISSFMSKQTPKTTHANIFDLGRKLKNADNNIRKMIYEYATDFEKWRNAAEFLEDIEKESNQRMCDYSTSMEIAPEEISFATTSHYTDNGNYVNIGNWVWKRNDGATKFSFDSEAERAFADILKDMSNDNFAKVKVGKKSKQLELGLGEAEPEKDVLLWGKNYVGNSPIKFEYYMGALHSSYPDFVMKDKHGRIHIFEVKSVNISKDFGFDNNIYKRKIAELKKAYNQASVLTGQIFYLPVVDGDVWQITQYVNGEERTLSQAQFEAFVRE